MHAYYDGMRLFNDTDSTYQPKMHNERDTQTSLFSIPLLIDIAFRVSLLIILSFIQIIFSFHCLPLSGILLHTAVPVLSMFGQPVYTSVLDKKSLVQYSMFLLDLAYPL